MLIGVDSSNFTRQIQWNGHTCAVKCMEMVLGHYGLESDYQEIRRSTKTGRRGTRYTETAAYLRRRGLPVTKHRGSLATAIKYLEDDAMILARVDRDSGHMLVLHGAHCVGNEVTAVHIADPLLARAPRRKYRADVLARRWGGQYLVVRPPTEDVADESPPVTRSRRLRVIPVTM